MRSRDHSHSQLCRIAVLLALPAWLACTAGHGARPAPTADDERTIIATVVPLSDAARTMAGLRGIIGDRRIVLLGENGHGVGPHTTLKVQLTRLLLDSLGFTTVIFESGFHECREADDALQRIGAVSSFRDCLAYAFEHAEALPLFEHIRQARAAGTGLHIAGADLQPQGTASLSRPSFLRQAIRVRDPALAEAAANADSGLLTASQRGGDSLRHWLDQHARPTRTALERALRLAEPPERWRFHTALALLRRGELRFSGSPPGGAPPAAYYAERDDFMARSVSWIADSLGARRKVVVWMHNDHVRLGRLNSPGGPVPATGRLLAARHPDDVVSFGFFMGEGQVTNNSRAVRTVLPIEAGSIEALLGAAGHEASLLALRAPRSSAVARWAARPHPYLRNGLESDTLTPADEFDALVFAARAAPPTYRLPNP